jgi:diacylglycerol kinase (ATP)
MSERLTGLARLRAALSHSVRGLRDAWSGQEAFRLDALAVAVAVPAGLFLGDGAVEKILLIGSVVLIMIVELLNSAIEAAIDRIGPEWHLLSRQAKDYGSAAVLITALLAALVWVLILIEKAGGGASAPGGA